MASVGRKVKREIERRFKQLDLTRMEVYIYCSMMEEAFGQGEDSEKRNHRGDLTISWIKSNLHKFVTGIREYQRLKVKDTLWKQTIVQDVLLSGIRVAELIIRVILSNDDEGNKVISFEVIDGQQRITAFIEFMNDEFTIHIKGKDMLYSEMETQASGLYHDFNDLTFGSLFYENITNEEASTIFKKVNDSTEICCQEDRNAIFGPYSRYIADVTYYGSEKDPVHRLFERYPLPNKDGLKKTTLPNFPKLDVSKQRMEQHEWFSHLIHWYTAGLRSTTNQDTHTLWQMDLDAYSTEYAGRGAANNLLKIANSIMVAASHAQRKEDITPMILQFMTLWMDELNHRTIGDSWSITVDDYVNGFLSCLDDYSHKDSLDVERSTKNKRCRFNGPNGTPWKLWSKDLSKPTNNMGEMKDLFGGHNKKAIETILSVLEYELRENPKQFGAKKLDPVRKFSREMIIEKWKTQNKCDALTGRPLDVNNIHGDHIVAYKNGIDAGGVTDWDNLQVISINSNLKKGSSNQFLKKVA